MMIVAFPPGEFIRNEAEARGWTRHDLSRIINYPRNQLDRLLSGDEPVTRDVADALARAFGTTALLWLKLEEAWQSGRQAREQGEGR